MTQVATPRTVLQESVYRALFVLNPALADLYEGARYILGADEPLPGWPRFVPHAIREIVTRLPDNLAIVTEPRVDYANRFDAIARRWQREGLPLEGIGVARPDGSASAPSVEILESIASLVQDHLLRPTQRERLLRLAESQAPDAQSDAAFRWANQLFSVHRWAQEHAHQPVAQSRTPVLDEYRAELAKFETAVAGLLADYGPNKGVLDDILAETNRRAD